MTSLLSHGAYSFPEAARFTGLRTGRIREWFRSSRRQTVFQGDYTGQTEKHLISFDDLIEVFIAGQLRECGVSLAVIRKAHTLLSEEWAIPHPFCRRELVVANGRILYARLDDEEQDEIRDVLTRQRAFPEIIKPFLQRLDYDQATDVAQRWHIAEGVELDPGICFGKPVASQSKRPTYILSAAYKANGRSEDAVARWYGVPKDDVLAAVAFEHSLSA